MKAPGAQRGNFPSQNNAVMECRKIIFCGNRILDLCIVLLSFPLVAIFISIYVVKGLSELWIEFEFDAWHQDRFWSLFAIQAGAIFVTIIVFVLLGSSCFNMETLT